MATGLTGPWGNRPPQRPKVGAGRTALVRRVVARGGNERRHAAQAARRGLQRGPSGRLLKRMSEVELPAPVKTAFVEVVRQSRLVQEKFLPRQRLRPLLLALAGLWFAWTFVIGDAGIPRLFWVRFQNERLERHIAELERDNARLQTEVTQLKSGGAEVVERIAREEHAMVKDGEVLVRFHDGKRRKD